MSYTELWAQSMVDLPQNTLQGRHVPPALPLEDPFFSIGDESPTPNLIQDDYPFSGSSSQYGVENNVYSIAQPGQSSASLISRDSETETIPEDDEARLTSNMGMPGHNTGWQEDFSGGSSPDTERNVGLTPNSRQKTVRYSVSPSPMKKTGSAFRSMSRSIRHISLRVVNLGGVGLDDSIRLPDDDDQKVADYKEEDLPDLSKRLPIRGRTLGYFGPQSRVRLALFNFLVHR